MLTTLEIECHDADIDPHIIDAIFLIESSWNPWVVRYERNWKYFNNVDDFAKFHRITAASEEICQKMSWGLGQVMGGTARFHGFTGMLTELTDPETNMQLVCKVFKNLQRTHLRLSDQAAAYNAGSVFKLDDGKYRNQDYVDKFMRAYFALNDFWPKNSGTRI